MTIKGTIFNIQRFSLHDGPGIRTTVFFKGCPLRCIWCHNPESFSSDVQITFDQEKCIECDLCKGFRDNSTVDKCPANAIEKIGCEITVEELFSEIMKDKGYFDTSNGGVSFSGGEPLLQHEFLLEILKLSKENNIHTAVDTCGKISFEIFEKINDLVDLYLFDLKIINDELHRKYTGTGNDDILKNLKFLSEKNKRIFIRFPVIPGITDTDENISDVIEFLREINFEHINLLSYHGYADYKYIKLGLEKPDISSDSRIDIIREKFESEGFKIVVGG